MPADGSKVYSSCAWRPSVADGQKGAVLVLVKPMTLSPHSNEEWPWVPPPLLYGERASHLDRFDDQELPRTEAYLRGRTETPSTVGPVTLALVSLVARPKAAIATTRQVRIATRPPPSL